MSLLLECLLLLHFLCPASSSPTQHLSSFCHVSLKKKNKSHISLMRHHGFLLSLFIFGIPFVIYRLFCHPRPSSKIGIECAADS